MFNKPDSTSKRPFNGTLWSWYNTETIAKDFAPVLRRRGSSKLRYKIELVIKEVKSFYAIESKMKCMFFVEVYSRGQRDFG